MFYDLEDDSPDPSFIRSTYANRCRINKGLITSAYEVGYVEFLTHLPENSFQGDEQENKRLRDIYTGGQVVINSDLDWHLPDILNFLEDHSGMLVGDAVVRCVDGPSPVAPATFEESFPHTRGIYPEGWIWHRRIRLFA